MKTSMKKRILTIVFVLALASTVMIPTALGASPSPSPSDSVSPSPSTSPEESTQPEGSTQPEDGTTPASADPNTPAGFQMLKLNDEGPNVIRVQTRLRDLGYFNYRATGKFFGKTQQAVKDFQTSNGADPDGRVGEQTYDKMFSMEGIVRKPLSPSAAGSIVSGPANENPTTFGVLGDWATINAAFAVGVTVKVTDVNKPDITFNMMRTGGANLATVETPTTEDYNKYLECFGGATNWEKRSVVVTIGDANYAASLFGNPSGADTIADNTMAGHTTLYFYGCTSDVFGLVDKEDLKMVKRAANESQDTF